MSEIPAQQIPTQPSAPIPPTPPLNQPQKSNFRKFFNLSSWIILFALAPLTVLIFLSQDSIPGDLFYPVKRNLENVILAAASVSPATRAAFRTDLTEIRFKEAQSLVISKSNASGLSTFIDEVQSTQLEVTNLTSDTERKKAEEKLISKIEEYQNGLSTLQAKTEQNVITYNLAQNITLTSTPIPPTIAPSPAPKSSINQSQSLPQPSVTSIPTPTAIPLPTTSIPTMTIVPTIASNIQTTPQESAEVLEQKKIVQTLKETKEQLHKIRKDLEEKRSEEKEKREKRNEDDKPDKEESNKKSGVSNSHE